MSPSLILTCSICNPPPPHLTHVSHPYWYYRKDLGCRRSQFIPVKQSRTSSDKSTRQSRTKMTPPTQSTPTSPWAGVWGWTWSTMAVIGTHHSTRVSLGAADRWTRLESSNGAVIGRQRCRTRFWKVSTQQQNPAAQSEEEICSKPLSNFTSNFTSNSGGKLKFKGKKCTNKTYIRAKQHELQLQFPSLHFIVCIFQKLLFLCVITGCIQ